MKPHKEQALRCAIYTRKSSEEGLEQDFNSLHAQREACEHTSEVSRVKAGACARLRITTAAFPARRWSVPHSNSCWRISKRARSTSWSSIRSTG
jgi:hypothetical protein